MNFSGLFFLILILFFLAYLKNNKIFKRKGLAKNTEQSQRYYYTKKKYFMTLDEREFYDVLHTTVGNEFTIFSQVHLPTIVSHKIKGQNWQAALNHINRKSVDFVLCNKSNLSPVLAIELDDNSHENPERQVRDAEVERILEEAELPLLRIKNRLTYDKDSLDASIRQRINNIN